MRYLKWLSNEIYIEISQLYHAYKVRHQADKGRERERERIFPHFPSAQSIARSHDYPRCIYYTFPTASISRTTFSLDKPQKTSAEMSHSAANLRDGHPVFRMLSPSPHMQWSGSLRRLRYSPRLLSNVTRSHRLTNLRFPSRVKLRDWSE